MYKIESNQLGDLSETIFCTEMVRKGWIVLHPNNRDSVYDFVVDLGEEGGLVKVQVKTLGNEKRLDKVMSRTGNVVSKNGKARNSLDYAKHGIDWLVGVDTNSGECHYYSLARYSAIPANSFSVKKHLPEEFPVNGDIRSHLKGIKNNDCLGNVASDLTKFIDIGGQ